jgi:hypothetical protein
VPLECWIGGSGGKGCAKFCHWQRGCLEKRSTTSTSLRTKDLCAYVQVKGKVSEWNVSLGAEAVRGSDAAEVGLEE